MSSDAPQQIDYAPPVSARRRLLRRWVPRVLLLALLASTYLWGPPAWDRASTLYWQRRCLNYVAPPERVVVDATLVAGQLTDPPRTEDVPAEWTRYYERISAPGLLSRGTVFLHERHSPDGVRHLVAVDYIGGGAQALDDSTAIPAFIVRQFRVPGGVRPAVLTADRLHYVALRGTPTRNDRSQFQLFAGQPDALDATHFTIPYRFGKSEGVIDGWVRRSGVEIELRGPSSPPPPPSAASSRAPVPPASTRPAPLPTAGG